MGASATVSHGQKKRNKERSDESQFCASNRQSQSTSERCFMTFLHTLNLSYSISCGVSGGSYEGFDLAIKE